MAIDVAEKRVRPTASRRLVREDYHRQPVLTYAEAALIAGVSVRSLENWIPEGKIRRVAKVGPYRISRKELDEFLRTGIGVNGVGRKRS